MKDMKIPWQHSIYFINLFLFIPSRPGLACVWLANYLDLVISGLRTPPRPRLNKLILSSEQHLVSFCFYTYYLIMLSIIGSVWLCVECRVHVFYCLSMSTEFFYVKTGNSLMDVSTVLSLQRADKKFYISEDRNTLPILWVEYARMCEDIVDTS